jgi:hypothetical protein
MANLISPLQIPLTNGVVRSFAQVRIESAGLPLNGGVLEVMRKRTREREIVYSNNADPVGKTTGQNKYEASFTALFDWYAAQVATLINNFGPGYGDQQFNVYLTHLGSNLQGYQDVITGCTFDEDDFTQSKGTSANQVKINLNPLKIYFAVPIGAPYLLYDDNPDPLALYPQGGNA